MTAFWLVAALLAAVALAFLLPPLLRARAPAADPRAAANAEVYREQLRELEAERDRGTIGGGEYERARREIERRVLSEQAAGEAPAAPAARRAPLAAAIAIAVLLPLAAGLGYWRLGSPGAILEADEMQHGHAVTREQMEALVERLAARMRETPDDKEGWILLGRSLAMLTHFERAADAYAHAAKLAPDDADVLADYADALAMAHGQNLQGEPYEIVKRALAIDPSQIKALALAGSAEFDAGHYPAAIGFWERALKAAPPQQAEFAQAVRDSIAEAQRRSGVASAAPAAPAAAAGGGALQGVITLDSALAAKVAPGDTVFVLARPASGPRMPLAVKRITVAQLPYTFTLDDSMAMAPGRTLSSASQVVVVARISRSGTAAPQKGDIEGASAPVAPGASGIKVVLSRVIDSEGAAPAAPEARAAPPAGGTLQGVITLDSALAAKVAPGDTVFVLARPASGPRMPLAVKRITVAQLPYTFTLDDSMAMAPGRTISSASQIVVVARVSKSGTAAPEKGDIEGASAPVAPGASGIKVVLSRLVD